MTDMDHGQNVGVMVIKCGSVLTLVIGSDSVTRLHSGEMQTCAHIFD